MSLSSYRDLSGLDQSQMTQPASLPGATVYTCGENGWAAGDLSQVTAGDILVLSYDAGGNLVWIIRSPGASGGGMPTEGGQEMPGGAASGTPSPSGGGVQQIEKIPTEPLEETTACALVPVETVTVTVSIDELDVRRIREGMTAQVTLDAIPGQSFPAAVAEVAAEGESDGGSTKYEAVIAMDRTEKMLAGMTASVALALEQREDCLTVPAEALQETDGATVLYTTYDAETDTLGSPVEVETGLSDGSAVEILSGLSQGDSFYYRYADTIVYSFLPNI
ncbi:MAG: HlyD family efflux transporter periplasmic adaptor subunit [Eubacteriales bacterium]|nr:HlyD family efflux transporter periplasmic adaptor subunit [Eubacteriales bacterium]